MSSKADYDSAQVAELCAGLVSNALCECRLAVIKKFTDTPFEEMRERFPPPSPSRRPSCSL